MATNVYIGLVLKSHEYKTVDVFKNVCSKNNKHNINNSTKFCPECGSTVVNEKQNTIKERINIRDFIFNNNLNEDLLYETESSSNIYIPNLINVGVTLDRSDEGTYFSLDDELFSDWYDNFLNDKELQNFISMFKEKYGKDSIEILPRYCFCYYS